MADSGDDWILRPSGSHADKILAGCQTCSHFLAGATGRRGGVIESAPYSAGVRRRTIAAAIGRSCGECYCVRPAAVDQPARRPHSRGQAGLE